MKSAGETTTEKGVAQTRKIFTPVMFRFHPNKRPFRISAASFQLCSGESLLVEDCEALD